MSDTSQENVQTDGLQAVVVGGEAENTAQTPIIVPETSTDDVKADETVETTTDETKVEPEVTQETVKTDAEPEQKGQFPVATVTNASGVSREYSYEVHGENYADLAEQFAQKVGGKVIYG